MCTFKKASTVVYLQTFRVLQVLKMNSPKVRNYSYSLLFSMTLSSCHYVTIYQTTLSEGHVTKIVRLDRMNLRRKADRRSTIQEQGRPTQQLQKKSVVLNLWLRKLIVSMICTIMQQIEMIHVPFILLPVQALPNEASTRDGAKQLDHKERPLRGTSYGPCKLYLFNLSFFPGKRLQNCKNSDSSKIPDGGNGGSLTTEHVKRKTQHEHQTIPAV